MRKGQVEGQPVERETPHLADLTTVRSRFATLHLAGVDDQHHWLVTLGVHADQSGQANGNSELLVDFANGGFLEHLASVDVAGWKAPQAAARIDTSSAKQHAPVVTQHHGHGNLRVEIVNEATRRARRAVTILLAARFELRAALETVGRAGHANSASGSSSSRRA